MDFLDFVIKNNTSTVAFCLQMHTISISILYEHLTIEVFKISLQKCLFYIYIYVYISTFSNKILHHLSS